jgi:exodeoxyribonuclease VII small subunit
MAKPETSQSATNLSYEAALEELETIIRAMEGDNLALEASLAAYQRGAVLLKHCQSKLVDAEQKVRILEGDLLKPLKTGDIE